MFPSDKQSDFALIVDSVFAFGLLDVVQGVEITRTFSRCTLLMCCHDRPNSWQRGHQRDS